MTRISVILPARNLRALIGEAIASIRAQSRPVDEIIVIDDRSNDGTGDVVAALAQQDSRLRLLTGGGRGPAAARNLGLRAASGEAIALLDGDDIWPLDKIERQMERLGAGDAPDIVSGLIRRFRRFDTSALAPADAEGAALPGANVGACLYRREVFARIGLFDESLAWCEDHDLMLRAREAGLRIAIMRQVTLYYRRRPGSHSDDEAAPADYQLLSIVQRSLARRRASGADRHLGPFAALLDP